MLRCISDCNARALSRTNRRDTEHFATAKRVWHRLSRGLIVPVGNPGEYSPVEAEMIRSSRLKTLVRPKRDLPILTAVATLWNRDRQRLIYDEDRTFLLSLALAHHVGAAFLVPVPLAHQAIHFRDQPKGAAE